MRKYLLPILLTATLQAQLNVDLNVTAVAGSGQTLYALAGTNLFRTIDGGANWTPLYIHPPGQTQGATALVADILNPNILYVVTPPANGGLWKTTDRGQTWTQINNGLPAATAIEHLLPVLTNSQTLYVKAGQTIYKTINGGAQWTIQSNLPAGSASSTFTVNVNQPALMYYIRQGNPQNPNAFVFRSNNEGATWDEVSTLSVGTANAGLVNGAPLVVSDPTNPDYVYTTVRGPFGGAFDALFVSSNRAASWVNSRQGLQLRYITADLRGNVFATGVEYTAGNPGGYLRSVSRGAPWNPHRIEGHTGTPLLFPDLALPGTIYSAGTFPFRSTDDGLTWTRLAGTVTGTLARPQAGLQANVTPGGRTTIDLRAEFFENTAWAAPFTAEIENAPWLTLDAANGTTPRTIRLTIDAANLTAGTHTANIRLNSTAAAGPALIPVTVTVAESRVTPYIISRVAGGGTQDPIGATLTDARITIPEAGVLDRTGRLWIVAGNRILRSNAQGRLDHIGGTGAFGFSGDNGPATLADFSIPDSISFGANNDVFITDSLNSRLRRIDAQGIVTTVAQYTAMGRATNDDAGNIYIARLQNIVRRTPAGQETTLAVNFPSTPEQIARDSQGNYYVAIPLRHRIVRVNSAGSVTTIAGSGTEGFLGDEGPATEAWLDSPNGVIVDADGIVYIADTGNNRIRMIDKDGIIHTIAGTGEATNNGDGGPAIAAAVGSPETLSLDPATGDILIAASNGIRRLALARPIIFPGGAVNAASYEPTFSPGSLIAIFGERLALSTTSAPGIPWPTTLAGVTLTLNGRLMAIYYASPGQINAMIPTETQPGPATLTVSVNGVTSAVYNLNIAAASPGIIVFGTNRAVAVNADGTVNTPENPAKPGTAVVIYLIGIGSTDTPVATGAAAPLDILIRPTGQAAVLLGAQPITPLFLGLTPGSVALAQLNLLLDENLPAGDYTIKITIAGHESNTPIITVTQAHGLQTN